MASVASLVSAWASQSPTDVDLRGGVSVVHDDAVTSRHHHVGAILAVVAQVEYPLYHIIVSSADRNHLRFHGGQGGNLVPPHTR